MSYPTKKLGEVCEINMGQSPASSTYNNNQNGLPFYQGKKDYGEKYPTPRVWCSNPIKVVKTGDILISVRAPVGALNIAKEKSCIGRGLAGLRAKKELDQAFLFRYLQLMEKDIADLGTGSTFTAISKKHLENLKIPLPPIAEQKKIVARLEGLLGKIKEAKHLRAKAEETAQNLLPAELHRIFSQPIRQAQGKQHSNILENVRMSGKPASVKNYGEARWEEKELGEVMIVEAKKNTKPLPYVGMEDIESGTGKFIGSKEKRAVRSTTSHFTIDHVLYGKLRPYLNKFLVPNFEGHCTTEFLPLRPDTRFLTREWLAVWLRHDKTVDNIMATTTGSRMPRANMNLVKKFKIPLPPIAEQKKIVARMDSLSEKIKKLQEYQKSTASDFVSLEQSILSKSFQ